MKTVFRVDASAQIGTGHLARCITLANSLRQIGVETGFLCRALDPFLADLVTSQGHALLALPAPDSILDHDPQGLLHAAWLGVSQDRDVSQCFTALGANLDLLVVDHYAIDHRWERKMRGVASCVMVIDDLADRKHDCDILLDQNLHGGNAGRYEALVTENCETLIGPDYALLRPEFSVPPTRGPNMIQRLNIFLGGTDPQGGTLLALEAITPICDGTLHVDVVAGGTNPHLTAIRRACDALPGVNLHVQTKDMAKLFAAADLAIGAGGSATLERCNRGLAQILTSFAQNQRPSCEAFAQAQVAVNVGEMEKLSASKLRDTIISLLENPQHLRDMGERGRVLVDGKGTQRVTNRIVQITGVKA